MPKKNKQIAGVIEIGSSEMRLKVAQNNRGSYKLLDSLTYPLSLGRDTFETGKISFEKANKACEIILNYMTVMKEYGAETTRAVATTALREAENTNYILDQIKIKTGLTLEVLDDEEEKRYVKRMMFAAASKEHLKSALMVYMGSGNISISVVANGRVTFMQNIKIGALRISELFDSVYEYSGEFYLVIEEYLSSILSIFKDLSGMKNFIAAGTNMSIIAELLNAKNQGEELTMTKESFKKLYDEIKFKTFDNISAEYKISPEKSELLFTEMCIYNNLLNFTTGDDIIAQTVSLSDAIIHGMLYPDESAKYVLEFDKNTIHNSIELAKKFGADEEHFQKTEKFSLKIFDKLRKLHGLGNRERLLLQIASILHDIGKAINIKSHTLHSYNIIKSLDITGLTIAEKNTIASIAYYHGNHPPTDDVPVAVSKLVAIMRLGDVLAKSGMKKYNDIDVKIDDKHLVIIVTTDNNIDLEKWAFNDKCGFFEEVFGIKAILKKKKVTK